MNKENKYQIKCIEYFLENGYIVYGNYADMYRYIPITFLKLNYKDFKIQSDYKNWKDLYNQKETMRFILDKEFKEKINEKTF